MRITIRRGLDVPLAGRPEPRVDDKTRISRVALLGDDYVGMKPTMLVREGEVVRAGQPLFSDKRYPHVLFTSPISARVVEIRRGEKRVFQRLVLQREGHETEQFKSYLATDIPKLTRDQVLEQLLRSGLWTAFRTRPYSKIPDPQSQPAAVFVTAMDTNPLAPPTAALLEGLAVEFQLGLQILTKLTSGKVYLCVSPECDVPGRELAEITTVEFAGPHPAGLPGTHIHFLCPVNEKRTVWHIGCQDVAAIGRLFVTGRVWSERILSLAGPGVARPRLIRTVWGANLEEVTSGELKPGAQRVISGSVLSGRWAREPWEYLGRYHQQISVIPEGGAREFLGWLKPGFSKFSIKRVFASAWVSSREFELTTSLEGSRRAMVPIGSYEQVMPLDLIPTYLLRSLIVGDTEQAQALGCLELDEEDLGLCTFVCPGKYEYGPLLRACLQRIEQEG
ncbi:MAG: Na(+)-translocating NADH-quinone reductase subunit A [Planctomycetaceae bacterium]|nr:MAG: Na(+)-translocating NADH-quinone reductase subunit A [Planctomycetaceae bacterium]